MSTETTHVATSQRLQPYRFIHKALRALMMRTLDTLATLDARQDAERQTMVAATQELLHVCADHLAHENEFFHRPLKARAPRAVMPFDDDHEAHRLQLAALSERLATLAAGGPDASAQAYALYIDVSRFVGESLEHMAEEEVQLTATLWQHFTDGELADLSATLQASLSPESSAYYLRAMARNMNAEEVGLLLAKLRASAPAEALPMLTAMVMDELPDNRRLLLV